MKSSNSSLVTVPSSLASALIKQLDASDATAGSSGCPNATAKSVTVSGRVMSAPSSGIILALRPW